MFEDDGSSAEAFLGGVKKEERASSLYSHENQRSCNRCLKNKYAMGGGLLLVLLGILFIIIFAALPSSANNSDEDSSSGEICYVYPSCTTHWPPNDQGFTNCTGYSEPITELVSESESCCDACLPGTNATVCFAADGSCANKTGDGDYDFLLLDEIWIPQLCRALGNDYDPTLSHVQGTQCQYVNDELSVHGLWPNYVDGYPQCCNASGNLRPLNPNTVESWDIFSLLQEQWYDPTASSECSVCYLLNHEWEKHGNCFSPGEPESYFSAGLALQDTLSDIDLFISSLVGTIVNKSDIESLYPKRPNIICDPNDPDSTQYLEEGIGILLETQTCWNQALEPIDCPAAFQGAFTYDCPEKVIIMSSTISNRR